MAKHVALYFTAIVFFILTVLGWFAADTVLTAVLGTGTALMALHAFALQTNNRILIVAILIGLTLDALILAWLLLL